jgi:outer membrane immunogenic protein
LTTYKVDQTDSGNDYGQYGNNISWLSTIRGRMGLAIGDTMVYGTAGLAIGGVKNTQFVNGDNYYSSSKTRLGWAVGGGVEHMVSRNWTVGLEAMFVDLGNSKGPCDPGGVKCSKFSNDAVIARFKANYKF